jgi:predicted Zn-dependent protease
MRLRRPPAKGIATSRSVRRSALLNGARPGADAAAMAGGTNRRDAAKVAPMHRRAMLTRSLKLIAMGALSSPFLIKTAASQERGPGTRLVLIRDAETETLLHAFADPLFRVAGVSAGLVRIMLVRDRALNAFVTTGNRMFINTGVIQQASSALEVIGVIAHETGHVAHGDISRIPEQQLEAMIESLGSLLIGAAAGVASRSGGVGMGAAVGGASMAQRRMMSFSRAQEESADQSALQYLSRLGWSASGMLSMFAKLEQQEALIIDRQDPYLVTHPMSRDRYLSVQHFIERSGDRGQAGTAAFEPEFLMVKAKLVGFIDPTVLVMRFYPESDPSPQSRYARAILALRTGQRAQSLRLLDSLIADQPRSSWLRELQGQVLLETGQPASAVPAYQEAVRLAPDQPLIRQSLGHAMIETGDHGMLRQAVTQLQLAQRPSRDDPETWHLLGIAWGRLGNLGEANLALAEEAILGGDIPVARRFARQAAETLPPGPSRLRALDISNAVKKENRS